MYVPNSPAALCGMLHLDPDFQQVETMERLARHHGVFDARLIVDGADGDVEWDGTMLRAALMVVLWRTLQVPGSRATIIAPSANENLGASDLGHTAMEFLAEVCKLQDHVLSSMTRLKSWHCIEFGTESGWEIRFVHNVPSIVAESAARSLTGLVLDAGDTSSNLGECARALESIAEQPRGLVLRLW